MNAKNLFGLLLLAVSTSGQQGLATPPPADKPARRLVKVVKAPAAPKAAVVDAGPSALESFLKKYGLELLLAGGVAITAAVGGGYLWHQSKKKAQAEANSASDGTASPAASTSPEDRAPVTPTPRSAPQVTMPTTPLDATTQAQLSADYQTLMAQAQALRARNAAVVNRLNSQTFADRWSRKLEWSQQLQEQRNALNREHEQLKAQIMQLEANAANALTRLQHSHRLEQALAAEAQRSAPQTRPAASAPREAGEEEAPAHQPTPREVWEKQRPALAAQYKLLLGQESRAFQDCQACEKALKTARGEAKKALTAQRVWYGQQLHQLRQQRDSLSDQIVYHDIATGPAFLTPQAEAMAAQRPAHPSAAPPRRRQSVSFGRSRQSGGRRHSASSSSGSESTGTETESGSDS